MVVVDEIIDDCLAGGMPPSHVGLHSYGTPSVGARNTRPLVRVFAVTIDRESLGYFPRIFGRGGYAVVFHPEHLATSLPAIYRPRVRE